MVGKDEFFGELFWWAILSNPKANPAWTFDFPRKITGNACRIYQCTAQEKKMYLNFKNDLETIFTIFFFLHNIFEKENKTLLTPWGVYENHFPQRPTSGEHQEHISFQYHPKEPVIVLVGRPIFYLGWRPDLHPMPIAKFDKWDHGTLQTVT